MLTDKQVKICRKYSARDENGKVHCRECPLVVSETFFMCRANSHYDRHTRNWEYDYEDEN